MFLEIILVCLWQIGILAYLILAGHLLKVRRRNQSYHGSFHSEDRILPDRLEAFRKRQPYATFKRSSRLPKLL